MNKTIKGWMVKKKMLPKHIKKKAKTIVKKQPKTIKELTNLLKHKDL